LVQNWDAERKAKAEEVVRDAEEEDEGDDVDEEPVGQEMVEIQEETPPSKSTRSRTKGKGKK
jgi:hypothetical protein